MVPSKTHSPSFSISASSYSRYTPHLMNLARRTLIALFLLVAFAVPAHAEQNTAVTYDERTLTQLYQASLKKGGPDSYIDKRIADERLKIRALADKEVEEFTAPTDNDTASATVPLTKSLDRQRALVSQLEEQLRDRKVDLDLLNEEEKKYYTTNSNGSGSLAELRLTNSHQELLAKKAILEERIAAFQAGLTLERDRLSKLTSQQRFDEFGTLFGLGEYILIILVALVVDRYVRRTFLRNIQDKARRYLAAKLFTAGVYLVALIVIMSKLLSDHPGALASFAIIGAGIAVALQDVVKDLMGWIIIVQRRLFTLGNRIVIGNSTGDVIDISLLRTTLLEVTSAGVFNAHERTGKILTIPNSLILREPVLNYNAASDFMSVELPVTVTYDSDWQKAEKILKEALLKETAAFSVEARKQQKRRTALYYTAWEVGEPEVHMDMAANGILFTLKFTVPIGSRRSVVTKLSHNIMQHFSGEFDVNLAYNTIHIVGGKLEPSEPKK